jgi:cbb3-type cytochrome oxidase subunit 3
MPAPQSSRYTSQYPKNPISELPPRWVLVTVGILATLLSPGGVVLVRAGQSAGFLLLLLGLFGIGLIAFAFSSKAVAAADQANQEWNRLGARDEEWTLDVEGDRLVRTVKSETTVTQLSDIAEIYRRVNAKIPLFKGIQKFTFVTYTGERFYLDSNVFKYEELGGRIIDVITPRLYRDSLGTVRNGGVARFGPVLLSAAIITITVDRGVFSEQPAHTYAWADVKSVSFEMGSGWQCRFVVHPHSRSAIADMLGRRHAVAMTDVPNVHTFIQLLQSMNVPIGGVGADAVTSHG